MSKTLANNKRGENMTTRKEKIANNDLSMEAIIEQFNTYHTFVVQVEKRDKLQNYLKSNGVDTTIRV